MSASGSSTRAVLAGDRRLLLLGLVLCSACGARQGPTAMLRAYQLRSPQRQLGRITWLAQFASDELGGTLSPDGRQLAYASDQKGQLDIWVKDLTTGLPRRITDHPAEDTQPAWAPDGRALAFVSQRADAKGDLYLWRDGKLRRLTGAATADAFPVFAPDGRSLFFSSGEPGREQIRRLELATGRSEAISAAGATHAALSADGRWLAYTRARAGEVARIELLRLGRPRQAPRGVTVADAPAGFPTFTADGQWLVFCRFRRGAAKEPRNAKTPASLWRVPLEPLLAGREPSAVMALAEQLTSDGGDALLPRAHARGLVITARHAGSLDLGWLPTSGLVPVTLPPAALRALARDARDPWASLLLWQHLERDRSYGSEARYASAQRWLAVGELDKARRALEGLAAAARVEQAEDAAIFVARAQIDLAVSPELLAQITAQGGSTTSATAAPSSAARARLPADAHAALRRLERLRPHLASTADAARGYLLLRQAELEQLAHALPAALSGYQRVIDAFASQRDLVSRAKLQLGAVYAQLRAPELVASYYLGLRAEGEPALDEAVARALIALHTGESQAKQLEALRGLLDRHRPPAPIAARLLARLALLHEQRGELDAAIESLGAGLQRPALPVELTAELGFELGRLALLRSRQLRQAGAPTAALAHYERALSAYERILSESDPASETRARATRAHLRLALLEATQLALAGKRAAAEARYRRLLALDDQVLQAHRGLLALGAASARRASNRHAAWSALAAPYRRRAQRDRGDAVAAYALGYLATLRTPLRTTDLDEAERWLKRARALRPQSPFGHMTLGWVYEMRERFFGARQSGWLEEAALAYEQAHALNDASVDPQTEADLLTNLANVFAALGNGWREVLEYCAQRRTLAQPFGSAEQEAFHRLSCGRAAAARGAYALAASELERAHRLARRLGLDALEVQVLAQLGVSEQLRGALKSSSRWLSKAIERVRQKGHGQALAPLQRTLAYNALLQRDGRAATQHLQAAEQALKRWGVATLPSFLAVATAPEPSTMPLGLDLRAERQSQRALREILAEQAREGPNARRLQGELVQMQQARSEQQEVGELRRELLLLRNRSALLAAGQGDRVAYAEALDRALSEARALREPEGMLDVQSFALEVGLALNRAEALLDALAAGAPVAAAELRASQTLLRALEARRAAGRAPSGTPTAPPGRSGAGAGGTPAEAPLLSQRLRLALWCDLALLTLQVAPAGTPQDAAAEAATGPVEAAGPGDAGDGELARLQAGWAAGSPRSATERAVQRLLARARPLTQAVRLLEASLAETDPRQAQPPEASPDAPATGGIGDALWLPLSARESRRWHLAITLALARAGVTNVPPLALEAHPSTELLRQVAAVNVVEDLGAQRYALSAELAYRRRDARAMAAAVDGLLERHPLLLAPADLAEAGSLRDTVFGRAIALALDQGDAAAALRYAELAERRAFLDELVALGPAGSGPVGRAIEGLLERAARYRQHASEVPAAAPETAAETWREELQRRERAVRQALQALEVSSPAVAELLSVGSFELAALQHALAPETVALRLLDDGARVAVVALRSQGRPRLHLLEQRLSALRALSAAARARLLHPVLSAAAGNASRILLDLGPLDDPEATPAALGLAPARVARLATLWELRDAQAVRRMPLPTIVQLAPGAAVGQRPRRGTPATVELRGLPAAALSRASLERVATRSGLLWLDLPLRWLGGSATNLVLAAGPGRAPWRWGHQLGLLLDSSVAALPDAELRGPGRRAQLVALLRFLHAAGVSAVALGTASAPPPAATTRPLSAVLPAAWARSADLPLSAALAPLGLTLFGDGGVDPAERKAFAQAQLKRLVLAGAKAFNASPRQLAPAIAALQPALHYMSFAGDTRLQAGALLYLANAHGLREDYARALAPMAELVALRRAALKTAEVATKPDLARLRAKAELVTALRQMAWLRLRHDQFDAALAANAETVAIYEEVRRPALLREALGQRSTIAERKGDHAEALRAARRSLALASSAAATPIPGAFAASAAGLAAAQDAVRVAQLLRLRFARFREATVSVEAALRWLPPLEPPLLPRAAAALAALRPTATALTGAWLELGRIASARGVFSDAVRLARRALALLTAAGLPQDAALLELVNSLYYAGALGEALAAAEQGVTLSADDPPRRLQFLNARGTTLAALGRSDAALATLKEALAEARRQGLAGEVAATLNNLGFALRLAGRADEAATRFGDALELDRARGDALGMSFALANRGLARLQLDLRREARDDLEQALALAQRIRAALNELKARHGLGAIELTEGRAELALAQAEAGLGRAREVGQRAWIWRFELQRARALRARGRGAEARQALERGAALIESLPPQLGQARATGESEEPTSALYDELVDLLATSGEAEAALVAAERARARAGIDAGGAAAGQLGPGLVGSPLQRVLELQRRLEALRSALLQAGVDAAERALLRAEADALEQALARARAELGAVQARLLRLLDPPPWDPARVAQGLARQPDTIAVVYYSTARRLVLWVVAAADDQHLAVTMSIVTVTRDRLATTLRALRAGLQRWEDVQPLIERLSTWLVAPLAGAARGPARHWRIVAPGPLRDVPFAALGARGAPLAAHVTLSYLPALAWLAEAPRPQLTEARGPWTSVAWDGDPAQPLPLAERESEALGRTASEVSAYTGSHATRQALLEAFASGRQVHLAAHVDGDAAAAEGAIGLADGRLSALEILASRVSAPLVVLSACEGGHATARGGLALDTTLLLAGAGQVVATTTRVSDLGAALLMKLFFRQRVRGLSAAVALQQAQLLLRARWPHPAAWATFRLSELGAAPATSARAATPAGPGSDRREQRSGAPAGSRPAS
ncbi:MAG: CHAT domain-containing protein [Proteobacteria bacterium]|nr:CHAT domain-containing protein [Pseudomonadota bacterium]